jgi:hypothetical protein
MGAWTWLASRLRFGRAALIDEGRVAAQSGLTGPASFPFTSPRLLTICISLVTTLLLSAGRVLGQDASLQGIVTSEGGPLVSVLVTLETQGQVVRTVGTDRNGLYLMGSVAPGAYTLRLRSLGYAVHEQTVRWAPSFVESLSSEGIRLRC